MVQCGSFGMMQDEGSKEGIKRLITFYCVGGHPFVRDIKHQTGDFDCTADGILATHDKIYQSAMAVDSSLKYLGYCSDSPTTQRAVRKAISQKYGVPTWGCGLHVAANVGVTAAALQIAGFPDVVTNIQQMINLSFNTKLHGRWREMCRTSNNQCCGRPTSRNTLEFQSQFHKASWALDHQEEITEIALDNPFNMIPGELRNYFLFIHNWEATRMFGAFGKVLVFAKKFQLS